MPSEAPARPDFNARVDLFAALSLLLLVTVVFGRSWQFDFINLDDTEYVTANAYVLQGLTAESVRWAFTAFHSGHWHPLTWLSLMLDTTLFGPGPAARHVVNVALHAINAALLYAVLFAATGCRGRSWLVAALFALHPLRVESVAWITERKDVLSGLFFLLTLAAWVRYARAPSVGRYAVVAVALVLGLLAKPMLVTVPALLLLVDVWPLGRWPRRSPRSLVAEKLPLLMLCCASAWITLSSQGAAGATASTAVVPLADRVAGAMWGYAMYLWKTVWPIDLAVFYPAAPVPATRVALATAALVFVTFLALRIGRRVPAVVVGWCWFVGMLVPVIGFVHVGGQAYADRFTYLPHIGLFVAVVWGAAEAIRARHLRVVAASVVVVASAATAWWQVGHWRDSVTLFRRALAVTSDNFMAHNNLGVALAAGGDRDEAGRHYALAVAANPTWPEARVNFGNVHAWHGDYAGARAQYEKALAVRPDFVTAWNNLATTYAREGDFGRAAEIYRHALEIDPDHADARRGLADVLERLGRGAFADQERARDRQRNRPIDE